MAARCPDGFSEPIQQSLRHLYERWDGKGMPGDLRGEQIPLAVRLMQVAQDADVAYQRGGAELANRILAGRAGSGLDPSAVAACLAVGDQVYEGLEAPSVWDDVLRAGPGQRPEVTEERLDDCLSAVADFADLKSMWTIGHSRGVAELAEEAAVVAGLPTADVLLVRRAALVHDIGRVAVPVGVWGKPGPLTRDEREQVRLHAYHSEWVLDIVPGLRPLARVAGSHGERSDGSGYHRGSRLGDLPPAAWLLGPPTATTRCGRQGAPAGAVRRGRGRRAEPGRRGGPDRAGGRQRRAGRGRPAGRPVQRPAGLSERECQVLGLLARGLATKQVARRLGISPKTCDHHIQSVYGKAGVSTRAGATLFALQHGLVSQEPLEGAG
ncbi:MAG: HD domain-containing phosphohydrolase [Actinomycetota bacterium]